MWSRLIIILVVFFVSSCQKEFVDPNYVSLPDNADFKAKINGQPFVADIYGATINPGKTISISAKSNDGRMLSFSVVDSGVHVYSLTIYNAMNIAGYTEIANQEFTTNGGKNSDESGGNLAILSIDSTRRILSGTFNFKVFRQSDMQQRTITEGVFHNVPW